MPDTPRNLPTHQAAYVLDPQTTCPIVAGEVGDWLDANDGVRKTRLADGTDVVAGGSASGTETLLAYVKTAAALPACTYDNGTNGVGATLTANANGALGTVGGVSMTAKVGKVILVDQQVAGLQNGWYVVTNGGGVSAKWVLTRLPGYDGAIPQGILTSVQTGTFAGEVWEQTATVATIGSDAPAFSQIADVMLLDSAQTNTGVKNFAAGTLKVDNDSTANAHIMASAATATRTATYPDRTGEVQLQLGGVQALSGAGAADVITDTTECTSSGAGQVVTLAGGTFDKQRKTVIAVAGQGGGNTTVVTPAAAAAFSTATLSAVGQSVVLQWSATLAKWIPIACTGTVA